MRLSSLLFQRQPLKIVGEERLMLGSEMPSSGFVLQASHLSLRKRIEPLEELGRSHLSRLK
jgi:hypothetical protein